MGRGNSGLGEMPHGGRLPQRRSYSQTFLETRRRALAARAAIRERAAERAATRAQVREDLRREDIAYAQRDLDRATRNLQDARNRYNSVYERYQAAPSMQLRRELINARNAMMALGDQEEQIRRRLESVRSRRR